ncbi:MAG: hypothetical protein KGI50_05355 [Patescibacteria group bacterium]|nr:hypothetical protein [Patescibacteria group bacterium]MDE2438767.1 hypothetical protein [Patescibacteria group bacterium]
MAGGKRIDDHSFWAGKGKPLPMESKMKEERSADGAGELGEYWDTTEKIKEQQDMGERKIKGYSPKPGYRN